MDKIILKEIIFEPHNSQTSETEIKIVISINGIDKKHEYKITPYNKIIEPQIGFIRRYNFKDYRFKLGDEKSINFKITHYLRLYNCYNESKLIDLEFMADNIDFVQCYYINRDNNVHLLSEYERPFKNLYDEFIRSFPLTAIYNKLYDYQYPDFNIENNKVIYKKISNYEICGLLKDMINSKEENYESYKETARNYLDKLKALMEKNQYVYVDELKNLLDVINLKYYSGELNIIHEMANGIIRFDKKVIIKLLDDIIHNKDIVEVMDAIIYKEQIEKLSKMCFQNN